MSKFSKWVWRKLFAILVILILFSLALVAVPAYINPPTWMWKLQRQLSPPAGYPETPSHHWVTSGDISPQMKLAVIAAEDQLFAEHWGFDLDSIVQAVQDNLQGERIRGASTLTQQTAKNLFLWSEKSLLRKGLEAYFTLLIELLLDKSRILEVYLNIVEFGPGIFGVEAASRSYFGKSALHLDSVEASTLAAVLPNPYRLNANKPTAYVRERSQWIRQQMKLLGADALRWLD